MFRNMSDNSVKALVIVVLAISIFDVLIMLYSYLCSPGPLDTVLYWVYAFLPASIFSLVVAGALFVVYGYWWPNTLSDATMYWVRVTWYIVVTKFLLQLLFTVVERTLL